MEPRRRLELVVRPRNLALRTAARLEEEIRAYPRIYGIFYTAMTRNRTLRNTVGRAKAAVRDAGSGPHASTAVEPALLRSRREQAVGARLGIPR